MKKNQPKIETIQTPTIGYFSGLDTLRFICATGVIFHHTWLSLSNKGFTKNALHAYSGAFFLNVFFIISGFLISFILIKEIQTDKYNLKKFYMRRIIRIWPLFFLMVLIRIIIMPMAQHVSFETIKTNLAYALSFSINYQLICEQVSKTYTILWSVCIEEHIYLLLPLFLLLFKRNIKNIALFLIISGFISWFYFSKIPSASGYNTAYFVSTSYFYYFGIGALLAYFHQTISSEKFKTLFTPTIQIIVFIVGALYVFNGFASGAYQLAISLICYGLLGAYLVCISVQKNFMLKLKPNVTRYLGNISYAMYLVHTIVVGFCTKIFTKKAINLSDFKLNILIPIVATLITVVLASLLYYLFEKHFLKLKTKYTTVLNK